MADAPAIRITSTDDLRRTRLTTGFRLILAIPHLLWFSIWSSGMLLFAPVLWITTLIKKRPPDGLHEVYVMWVRYSVHVYAYVGLAADPFPGFLGKPGTYPVDAEIPKASDVPDQNRWSIAFRFVLALPPLAMANTLGGSGSYGTVGIVAVVPFLAWFAILARGRMPQGFEGAMQYALGYCAQAYSYLFLVTPRYPNAHPAEVAPVEPLPPHPVRVTMADDLHRSRLTIFFRLPLAIPHFVWFYLWEIAALLTAIVMWFATLITGRPPAALHRFVSRFTRYQVHLLAFVYTAAGPFPGFVGAPGSYPIDVEIDGPERQNRWRTVFRIFLAIPALLVSTALGSAAQLGAVGAWFFSLFTARAPLGLRALMTWSLRYQAQLTAYVLMLTEVYPFSAPGPIDRAAEPPPSL
jgi:hypothetical protein